MKAGGPYGSAHREGLASSRDATRLAKALADADELWLGPCGHGGVVIARADGEELGMLTHLEDPSMAQALFDAERPGLCVSAGGPTRRTVRPGDLQLLVPVRSHSHRLPAEQAGFRRVTRRV